MARHLQSTLKITSRRTPAFWNSFAGAAPFYDPKPVKKFTDRKVAVARIWNAVQRLSRDVVPQATLLRRSGPGRRSPQAEAARRAPEKDSRANKKAEVIAMMKRVKGVTLAEIMEATGWQTHTVRGFVSILASKGGENIDSSKNAAGKR